MSEEEAFDKEAAVPGIGAFGLWQPGMDLVVRFADESPGVEEFTSSMQADFIRDLKNLALRYCLAVKDWGPSGGMVAKILMESEDDPEPRLRDIEAVLMALVDSGGPLPDRALPAFKRIAERVQGR